MRLILSLIIISLLQGGFAQSFVLPKLPYAYEDYSPYIDAQTMEIHLTKHHQAYVNNLNKAIKGSPFETMEIEDILIQIRIEDGELIRNNAGGHYNHSLFWDILAPPSKQGAPGQEMLSAIKQNYGSIDSLKKEMNKAGMSRFGSGWAWLMVTPSGTLAVVSTANQDNPLMIFGNQRGIPILGIDVWEHAYYLNYQNRRADYLNAVWSLVDWAKVSEKYNNAMANSGIRSKLNPNNKTKKKH